MDHRTYLLFQQYEQYLEYFSPSPKLALWALGQHAEHRSYSEADIEAVVAEHERQEANPSPMVHFTQRELDMMLANASLLEVPPELRVPKVS